MFRSFTEFYLSLRILGYMFNNKDLIRPFDHRSTKYLIWVRREEIYCLNPFLSREKRRWTQTLVSSFLKKLR